MSDSEESCIEYSDEENKYNNNFNDMVYQIKNQINENGELEKYMKDWIYRQFHFCHNKTKLNELLSIKLVKEMYERRKNKKSWLLNYNELKKFISINDKIPSTMEDVELRKWLQNQRSLLKTNKLNQYKYNKLLQLKHIDQYLKSTGREKWDKVYEEIKEFIRVNGYLPSYSVHSNANEKRLAKWLTTQIQVIKGKREWSMSEQHKTKLMEIELIKQRVNCK
jgi:hypothetical protein